MPGEECGGKRFIRIAGNEVYNLKVGIDSELYAICYICQVSANTANVYAAH